MILESDYSVAFTGAGVSTESEIPDFRSSGGIWDRYDPSEFTYRSFREDPAGYWKKRLKMRKEPDFDIESAQPNPAHKAIVELEDIGKLSSVSTQNIDNLRELPPPNSPRSLGRGFPPRSLHLSNKKAGNSVVIKLHGTSSKVRCLECEREYQSEFAWKRAEDGELPPKCECGGTLKSDTVLFGESLPQEDLRRAREEAKRCDLMLVVGSSPVVQPAASIPRISKRGGAKLCIVNLDPTRMDEEADVVIHGKAGEILPKIVDSLRQARSN